MSDASGIHVYSKIIGMLDGTGAEYATTEHEPVLTSEQAAKVRGVPLKTGVKAMVMKTLEGSFFLTLVPADRKVDMRLMAKLEGASSVFMATPEEVMKLTGCMVGAVPPFGHKTRLRTYMHRAILENEWVNFNAGVRTRSVRMKAKDLKGIIKPQPFS